MTLGEIKNLSEKHRRLIRRLIRNKRLKSYANGAGFDVDEFNQYVLDRADAIKRRSEMYRSEGITELIASGVQEIKAIDVAERVGVSRERVRQWVENGEVCGRKEGKFVFVNVRSLLRHLDKRVRDLEKEWRETMALRFP